MLEREFGDAIIIGAINKKQLEENLINLEKVPLPEEVVKALDEGWETVRGICAPYFHWVFCQSSGKFLLALKEFTFRVSSS